MVTGIDSGAAYGAAALSSSQLNRSWDEAGAIASKLGSGVDKAFKNAQAAYRSGDQAKIQKADLELRRALAAMEGFNQSLKVMFEAIMSQIRKLELR